MKYLKMFLILILSNVFVYLFVGLSLLNYEDSFDDTKGNYYSLESMNLQEKVIWIFWCCWILLNITGLLFILIKMYRRIKKNYLLFLVFLTSLFPLIAQNNHDLKIESIFLEQQDSTKNKYTIIYPPINNYKGYVLLIPGFGENAESVMVQTQLPLQLAHKGLLTIIPTFGDGKLSLGVDNKSQTTLNEILIDVNSRFDLKNKNFFIGGFSIGGSCAIKYAELSEEKTKAVFAIDPPLDFERFYYSAKRDIRLTKGSHLNQENLYMINRLEKETGGNPETHLEEYRKLSPYSFSDENQTAIKKLINVPIRIYSEPDIDWWINNRGADLTSMNVTDCSAMINELYRLGNNNVELILTQDKGFRKPNNNRHPHSWSIVDNEELIKWLLEFK